MKKIILPLLATIVAVQLAGCSDEPTENQNEEINTTASSSTSSPSAPKNKKLLFKGLSGSYIYDVILNMQKHWNIPEGKVKTTNDSEYQYNYYEAFSSYELLGLELDYYIHADSNYQITSGTFSITKQSNCLLSNEQFFELSKNYLTFASTMPYDSNNTNEAKTWVEENIQDFAPGPSTIIGDAEFSLRGMSDSEGNPVYISLEIGTADFFEQISKIMNEEEKTTG